MMRFVVVVILIPFLSFSKTVVDMEGRRVCVPDRISRVVVLVGEAFELITSWGDLDKVVGVSSWVKRKEFYRRISKGKLVDIPDVGTGFRPNLEKIVALKPDVVITFGGPFGFSTPKSAVERLESLGISVVLVILSRFEDNVKFVELMGRLMGREDKAKEVLDYFDRVVGKVRRLSSKIKLKKKVLWLWSTPNTVTASEGVVADVIEMVGAVNPASSIKGQYVKVPLEKIVEWNPDVMFIWEFARYGPEDLYSDSRWSSISAVKNRRIFKEPDYLATWGVRSSLLLAWVFDKVYPGTIDYRGLKTYFFSNIFGLEP